MYEKVVEVEKRYKSERVVEVSVRVKYYKLVDFRPPEPYEPELTVTTRTWRIDEGWDDPEITIEKGVTFKYSVFNTFTKLIQEAVEELEKVIKEVEANENEKIESSVARENA